MLRSLLPSLAKMVLERLICEVILPPNTEPVEKGHCKLVELVELDLVELGRSVASITSEETEEWRITKCCCW